MTKNRDTPAEVVRRAVERTLEYITAEKGVFQSTTYRFRDEAKAISKKISMKSRISPFQKRYVDNFLFNQANLFVHLAIILNRGQTKKSAQFA